MSRFDRSQRWRPRAGDSPSGASAPEISNLGHITAATLVCSVAAAQSRASLRPARAPARAAPPLPSGPRAERARALRRRPADAGAPAARVGGRALAAAAPRKRSSSGGGGSPASAPGVPPPSRSAPRGPTGALGAAARSRTPRRGGVAAHGEEPRAAPCPGGASAAVPSCASARRRQARGPSQETAGCRAHHSRLVEGRRLRAPSPPQPPMPPPRCRQLSPRQAVAETAWQRYAAARWLTRHGASRHRPPTGHFCGRWRGLLSAVAGAVVLEAATASTGPARAQNIERAIPAKASLLGRRGCPASRTSAQQRREARRTARSSWQPWRISLFYFFRTPRA